MPIYVDKAHISAVRIDWGTTMLVEFSIGNYRSFRDVATFSMIAADIKAEDKILDRENVFQPAKGLNLLKAAALYGANASGKSNLIRAMGFMRWFIMNSSKDTQTGENIDVEFFKLSSEAISQAAFFEIVFITEGQRYRYGFEANAREVRSEWLYHVPSVREARLFERDSDGIVMSRTFAEGRGLESKTRNNALFLSVAAQFNGPVAKSILKWFNGLNTISGLNDRIYRGYTVECFDDPEHRRQIIDFVKNLDTDIVDIQLDKTIIGPEALPKDMPEALKALILSPDVKNVPFVKTIHNIYDANGISSGLTQFDLDNQESDGTQKLFSMAGPVIDTLRNGGILAIDELDARLHPLITLAIVGLFDSCETNPCNAQLVFATHDTNLLDRALLRRDQIWFVEKDRQESSHLCSLVEYKVRNDASFKN